MPLSKKKRADKRPSYETDELRDPKIAELQVREGDQRRSLFALIKKAVAGPKADR